MKLLASAAEKRPLEMAWARTLPLLVGNRSLAGPPGIDAEVARQTPPRRGAMLMVETSTEELTE